MDKVGYRAVIMYLQLKGLSPFEIHMDMVATLGDNAPVQKWAVAFKRGRESLENGPRSGRPKSATSKEVVDGQVQ